MTKISKVEAKYSPTSDNPSTKCSGCSHFESPSACERIVGKISPSGWCRLWKNPAVPEWLAKAAARHGWRIDGYSITGVVPFRVPAGRWNPRRF